MMKQAVKIKETLSDESRMEEDCWNICSFDFAKSCKGKRLPRTIKRGILDFGKIGSITMREELKSFYRQIILTRRRSARTFICSLKVCHYMIDFLSSLPGNKSTLDYEEDDLYKKYKKFLKAKNEACILRDHAVRKEQKYHVYLEDSCPVLEIKSFYQFLLDQKNRDIAETDKDIWDVRRLPFQVTVQSSRPRYILNFTGITQLPIRKIFKRYILQRLKLRKLSTVMDDMKAMNLFSDFLRRNYPDIQELPQLKRPVVLDYFRYIDNRHYVYTTAKSRKGCLKTFFENVIYLDLADIPTNLILRKDYRQKIHIIPRVIPPSVMDQLQEAIPKLPQPVQNIVILIAKIGMRINEACRLSVRCLKKDSEGGYYIEYYQYKTEHYNRIPISDSMAELIKEQQKETKKRDPHASFLFTIQSGRGKNHLYPQESVSRMLNILAVKEKITGPDGKIFRFQSHQFRHTVATDYARQGFSPLMIQSLLGHRSPKSIMPYVEYSRDMEKEKLRAFFEKEGKRLSAAVIGPQGKDRYVPLVNGYCTDSSDLCEDAWICYSCSLFSMDTADKALMKQYLVRVRQKAEDMEMKGFVRESQLYRNLERNIIQAMEESNHDRSQ